LLADQLTANTLLNNKQLIRLNRIKLYLKNYPKLRVAFDKLKTQMITQQTTKVRVKAMITITQTKIHSITTT